MDHAVTRPGTGDIELQASRDSRSGESFGPDPESHQRQWAVELLDGIGTQHFGTVLERMLISMCGAVQFASYRKREGKASRIAGHLSEDKVVRALRDLDSDPAEPVGNSGEPRLSVRSGIATLRGRHGGTEICLVVECDSNRLDRVTLADTLASRSGLLLTAHAKHLELLDARESAIRALASIDRIQECLTASGMLTIREIEVCSRIIYGLSTLGIAVDLSLSEETVRTYRKRAYQRLALGTERQLLTWYLRQWTHWNALAGHP